MTARRKWTDERLQWVAEQWRTRTLSDIADELGLSYGGLKAICSRYGVRCPVSRSQVNGRRRQFGPVDRRERDKRRRWYRMWNSLRVRGVPSDERLAQMRDHGCTLTAHQLRCGWLHYQRTHLQTSTRK